MRATRTLRLIAVVTLATVGMTVPADAAAPAQQCTRPASNTPKGTGVARPGLNARPTPQKITVEIKLLGCEPADETGSSGILTATFKPPGGQTCALFRKPHALKGAGKIAWKNGKTSALALTFSLSGTTAFANVSGKVSGGLFATHAISGQFHFTAFASHSDTTVAQACAGKVAPGQPDRNSIVKFELVRTKPFAIK